MAKFAAGANFTEDDDGNKSFLHPKSSQCNEMNLLFRRKKWLELQVTTKMETVADWSIIDPI